MKVIFLLMILLSVGIFLFVRSAGPVGFLGTSPLRDVVAYDLQGRAMRQVKVHVHDQQALDVQYSVTIFGSIDEVVEPWLSISPKRDGLELVSIDGSRFQVPVDHEIITRYGGNGEWRALRGSVADTDLPSLDDGVGLPEILTERWPEESELWVEVLPPAVVKAESSQGGM